MQLGSKLKNLFQLCKPIYQISKLRMDFTKYIIPRDIVSEIIDSGPMCITDLFQNKSVEPKIEYFPKIFFLKSHLYDM